MLETLTPILGQLSEYGRLIVAIISAVLVGILIAFALYRVARAVIKPQGAYARALAVVFGTLFVLILVLTALVAASRIGLPVEGLAGIALLLVILGGVVVFFLLPFLPRVPFARGDTVDIRGVMGVVDSLTTYQVVLHTFDGQIVYMPTPLVMTSPITNFSGRPNRRIDLAVDLLPSSDLEKARELLLTTMAAAEEVLEEPGPAIYVTQVAQSKVTMLGLCWVENPHWFAGRDKLWRQIVAAINREPSVQLAQTQIRLESA